MHAAPLLFALFGCTGADQLDPPAPPPDWPLTNLMVSEAPTAPPDAPPAAPTPDGAVDDAPPEAAEPAADEDADAPEAPDDGEDSTAPTVEP